jgi:hypothetical protein
MLKNFDIQYRQPNSNQHSPPWTCTVFYYFGLKYKKYFVRAPVI